MCLLRLLLIPLILIITTLLHTISLIITVGLLPITLVILVVGLLAILRVCPTISLLLHWVLTVLLWLVVLPILLILLARLKGLGSWLKGIGIGCEFYALPVLAVNVEILLCLTRQLVIFYCRVIFPRLKPGHSDRIWCTGPQYV